jgi:hypothetical protein
VRQEELVDSVIVDATIYNTGGPHLGAFPGLLFSAFHQLVSSLAVLLYYLRNVSNEKGEFLWRFDNAET